MTTTTPPASRILICDLIGLAFHQRGEPDPVEVRKHIEAKGGCFIDRLWKPSDKLTAGKLHFFYAPDLSKPEEILKSTSQGQYDAVIAAATFIPKDAVFRFGGVRIGTGTGNMGSASWGGSNGVGGEAPLMNTPGFNSRATAQMAMKALLRVSPDLPVETLHTLTVRGRFDTGKDLRRFPTRKLEGQTVAVFGYGNIGRAFAKLAQAFGMKVQVYAREKHRAWIESEGFVWCATPTAAATGADVLSVHVGLGSFDPETKQYANAGLVNSNVLQALNKKSILINYDRGECIDVKALDRAMKQNIIRHAAIDADIFKAKDGKLTGPLAPYLPLAQKYPGRTELLPHAAADTEHVSRVEGAKQAVDQIYDSILYKRLTNLKGDCPPGYTVVGAHSPPGVARPTQADVAKLKRQDIEKLQALSDRMAEGWREVQRGEISEELLLALNTYRSLLQKLGL
jgi:lactate dehydrogenase-like 2-hydroxyacid dehydrogenase